MILRDALGRLDLVERRSTATDQDQIPHLHQQAPSAEIDRLNATTITLWPRICVKQGERTALGVARWSLPPAPGSRLAARTAGLAARRSTGAREADAVVDQTHNALTARRVSRRAFTR